MKAVTTISRAKTAEAPASTTDHPFAQLEWLWNQLMSTYSNRHTQHIKADALRQIKRYIQSIDAPDAVPPVYLKKLFTKSFLTLFYQFLLKTGLSLTSVANIVTTTRQLLRLANKKELTAYPKGETFTDVTVPKPERIAPGYSVYSNDEMKEISDVLQPFISRALSIKVHEEGFITGPNQLADAIVDGLRWAGYQKKGIGQDPYAYGGGRNVRWNCWENMVWYFENRMNAKTLSWHELKANHRGFLGASSKYYGGLDATYERLHESATFRGGPARILAVSPSLLVPLFMRLLLKTGLNIESAISLKTGCIRRDDPISGQPYLVYFKARSKGSKRLYLNFLEKDMEEAEKLDMELVTVPLKDKQGAYIIKLIELIEKLTGTIRARAPAEIKDYLFITQIKGGDIVRLLSSSVESWLKVHADSLALKGAFYLDEKNKGAEHPLDQAVSILGGIPKLAEACGVSVDTAKRWVSWGDIPEPGPHHVKGDYAAMIEQATNGKVQSISLRNNEKYRKISLARFRPTVITELIEGGKSVLEAQLVAGHASSGQTFRYLAMHNIKPQWHKRAIDIAASIHRRSTEIEQRNPLTGNPKVISIHVEGTIYPGLYADCANVFDPHKDYIKMPSYRSGMPCGYWNGCLLCNNVLITKKHLPLIASLELQLSHALAVKLQDHPQRDMYELQLAVIMAYYDRLAETDPVAVEQARANARFDDVYVNSLLSAKAG